MDRLFAACARLGAALCLVMLLSAPRIGEGQAQPVFFSLLFPGLMPGGGLAQWPQDTPGAALPQEEYAMPWLYDGLPVRTPGEARREVCL